MVQQGTANNISIKALLEAGAHFGHQTSRWNPKMKSYIFTQRNGIHIIDLEQTVVMLEKAFRFIVDVVSRGKSILFVGTKRQAQEAIELEAKRCGMFYVNQRWLGGMFTNFSTIQGRIDHLVRLEDMKLKGELEALPKKEVRKIEKEIARMNRLMGGFKEMTSLPGAIFIDDTTKERIAVQEAKSMGIPIVAITDTNSNPREVDYAIPANDDAIRAIKLICSIIADAVLEGKALQKAPEGEDLAQEMQMGKPTEASASLTFSPDEGRIVAKKEAQN
ncbi:MAG: 30S ribosomal protein S2 [Candidatus Tectomicrobia bacterium]|uniref:Small ribosomal subunit protein uS2 n=1 Tax=Tectimicrobiota bacterium TaxID=2528274 RepID=A0A933GMG7_UNCTE|nr:30S ribosomal protein S2 [Candidatus Tectomicrobia bacterium]